jgi:hypothetical protein
LLVLHVVLATWVATRNSVTFDENFHLPAGVVALARADFSSSYAQPPLSRALCGAAALAAGARLPDPKVELPGRERQLGESFMRRNADRYQRVFMAGRMVVVAMSAALGWLIWKAARRRYGPLAGLVATGLWTFSPDALAHGSMVGVDVPTALAVFGAVLAGAAWLESGRWRDWAVCAAWTAAAFLVRFSAVQVLVALVVVAVLRAVRGAQSRPLRVAAGLTALGGVAWFAVCAGYLFQGVGTPLGRIELHSPMFVALGRALAGVPSPLPEPYLRGLDYIGFIAQPGLKPGYFLGAVTDRHHVEYFPVAMAVKWPLGFLALLLARKVQVIVRRGAGLAADSELIVPALVVIGMAMSANLDYGVRYLVPALPFLCVWVSGLAALPSRLGVGSPSARSRPAAVSAWAWLALLLALAVPVELAHALPYPLSFFNAFAAAPGQGERIVNDSNVDWGQGLIALREDMARLGIRRVHLAYHGTTDPAMYGIDYVPYFGGALGPEADWIAMSSYFYVGLPARLITSNGYTAEPGAYDARPLWSLPPAAHPAGCMWLFRIR